MDASGVLCIGSVSQDVFFPTGEGVLFQTPGDITSQQKVAFEVGGKYRIDDRFEAIGGVAANVSVGLSRLGYASGCCGMVGDDLLGTWIRTNLEGEGVSTEYIGIVSDEMSDLSAIIVLTQTGERTIFHNRDSAKRLSVSRDTIDGRRVFVSSLNGSHWRENFRTALDGASWFSMNPGLHNIQEDPKLFLDALSRTDSLLLNKDEAIELLLDGRVLEDRRDLENEWKILETFLGFGVGRIGLTDGKRGAWAADSTGMFFAEPYEQHPVIDTTGAGDAFSSGFLAAHLLGLPIQMSLSWGVANGGSVIGYYGAIAGLHTGASVSESAALVGVISRSQMTIH